MDQLNVYRRIHFLRELRNANVRDRKGIVRYMTAEQMEALGEVVRYIIDGSIRVLPHDGTQFRERSLVLRHVSDQRISLRRKHYALIAYHDIIPRILRPHYVRQAIVLSIRSIEQ